jgi:chorismate synthase
MSIPAVRGFEMGSGMAAATMRGSLHNDPFTLDAPATIKENSPHNNSTNNGGIPQLRTMSNNCGGAQGGIAIGGSTPLIMRIAFKPPATIGMPQQTVDYNGTLTTLRASGRHDPCVVPRAVPIVEAMAALVLADLSMTQLARTAASSIYPIQPHPGGVTIPPLTSRL